MMALGSKGANHCWNMQAFCSYTTKTYFYSAARCAQSNLAEGSQGRKRSADRYCAGCEKATDDLATIGKMSCAYRQKVLRL